MLISGSILSADFLNFEENIKNLEPYADAWHVDVMDGHYVPNISFGPQFGTYLAKCSKLPVSVHLMVREPEKFVRLIPKTVQEVTFHQEATVSPVRFCAMLREMGFLPGVSIGPGVHESSILEILPFVHHVLFMSVEPGFGGQSFIEPVFEKIKRLTRLYPDRSFEVWVDGGVDMFWGEKLKEIGVDLAVMGSAFFKAKDPGEFRKLRVK